MNSTGQQSFYDEYWKKQKALMADAHANNAVIAACILVFIAGIFSGRDMYEAFALDSEAVFHGLRIYTLITSMFMHASLPHLFSNMIILLLLGAGVERITGHVAYLILYLTSGIVGNIISAYWYHITVRPAFSVGASGAVFGVIAALVVSFFTERIVEKRAAASAAQTIQQEGNDRELYVQTSGDAGEDMAYSSERHQKRRADNGYGTRLILMVIYMLYSGFAQEDINNAAHFGGFITGLLISAVVMAVRYRGKRRLPRLS